MVLIPGGTFIMGSPEDEPGKYSGSFGQYNERPQHEVTIAPFWMGRYPITVAQWRAVSTLPPVEKELDPYPFYISPDPVIFPRDALFGYFKVDDFPVERVTWDDAIEFCYRLSAHTGHTYTLPSEAQWEYACRAGTTTPFYFGKHITPQWANYNDSADPQYYRERTTPVGMFGIANPFGLYDMHGNVWERCLDHYWYSNYKGAPTDGSAWVVTGADKELPRILRGGSWYSFPGECRCASRHCDKSILLQSTHAGVGFRVVSIPSRL
jgi:formylglycine-generating enzyme required for sulfatase activity